ncbi:MAG: kynureninase [Actinomycetota bacterium]|nr:kynureninase [Actinomycetota bacterium]
MAEPSSADRDAAEPLRRFRERFAFPDPDLVYLDGNSLGRLPVAAVDRAAAVVGKEWGDRLIRSWNEGWWEAPLAIGDAIAPLIGARTGEVAVADSTSVNLFKLAVAAMDHQANRPVVLTDDLNFPSDWYILEAAARRAEGTHRIEVIRSPDRIHGPVDAIIDRLSDDVALLSLSLVTYGSGYLYDLERVTAAAHATGAMVLWDLSHAAGAVPIDLGSVGVDLTVGCTYKYLNGGPGSPAFLSVRSDLQDVLGNPVAGWWGHATPFGFDPTYRPTAGIRRFLTGTAPMVSMALIEPGVAMLAEAGMTALRAKSAAQIGYLIERWRTDLAPLGFTLGSPADPDRRGSHVSLDHPQALAIDLALIADHGVIPDFRPPASVRFGIAPLYNTFADLDRAVEAMIEVVTSGRHLDPVDQPAVT